MKIAVITANIGGIDPIFGMPKQECDNVEYKYFYYNESNLPFPLTNLNDRYKSRYLKIQTHRFLPDFNAYIWLDGRFKITSNKFIDHFVENLKEHDIVLYKHRERKNVFEELNFIVEEMNKGSKYLLERYANQQLIKEAVFYKASNIENMPLVANGIFIRLNNIKVNSCFDEWWRRCIEFSNSDQTMLSVVLSQYNLNANYLEFDEIRTPKLFVLSKHLK